MVSDGSKLNKKPKFIYKKNLGQNFLIDKNISLKIVNSANFSKSAVIEIGAGTGNLTKFLAAKSELVLAIEKDSRFISHLKENVSEFKNVTIIKEDFLKLDLIKLTENLSIPISVCSNLPYCISTQVLTKLLSSNVIFEQIILMLQKEYAAKIITPPQTKNCSALSYFVHYHCQPKLLFNVSKTCFHPAPKVSSSVVCLTFHKNKPITVSDETSFFNLIRASFEQRRKFLINSISSKFNLPKNDLLYLFNQLKISPSSRAENLNLIQFAAIFNSLHSSLN